MVAPPNEAPQGSVSKSIPVLDAQLEEAALEILNEQPQAVIVWVARRGGGWYGYEVWTPEGGHVVTVLEV